MADGGGTAQADRCGAPAAQRRGRRPTSAIGDRGAARAQRAGGRGGERDRYPRRPAVADVRLRPPGDRARHPRAADAADHFGLRRRHHRVGLPGLARHHGPAPGARQEQDPASRHSVPHARARRSAPTSRGGAGGDLRRLRRRLVRSRRHREPPPQPGRGSDLAGPAGRLGCCRTSQRRSACWR